MLEDAFNKEEKIVTNLFAFTDLRTPTVYERFQTKQKNW